MRRTWIRRLTVAATLLLIGGGVAAATPGTNATSTVLGSRSFSKWAVENRDATIAVARNTYDVGGDSGWHSHPGKVLIAVESGEITIYRGDDPTCTGKTHTAGSIFVERPGVVYLGRNESSDTPAVLIATFFNVGPDGARLDQPDPGTCSF